MQGCRLAVDIGGTFTDVVLELPDDRTVSGKVLTTLGAPEKGVLEGITRLMSQVGVAPGDISMVLHGTTLATNAIIERTGPRTALLTTEGFRDTLEFALGHRFDQYDLELVRPGPLIERRLRLEVGERMASDGSVLKELGEDGVLRAAEFIKSENIQSLAVCFLHSYANGGHEARAREILKGECPDLYVSLSHEVCPEIREYERTSTTAANAYVQPMMVGYLTGLAESLSAIGLECPLLLIMSTGSLTSIETAIRLPIRLVESGPAGGAILGQHIARELDADQSIAFDMGGTTAKIVLLNDFEARHSRSMEVARAHSFMPGSGIPLRMPVIDMIEIGAGGGSIASLDQLRRIAVGPESAGSNPGPACYGLGGILPTVTDADLILGKLDPDEFAGGTMKLDEAGARAAMERDLGAPLGLQVQEAAAGLAEIVDENMANATRVNAADHGDQVETRVLIATGGAAPLHAARIAEKLSIDKIVIPADAGVGSAYGFLMAPVAYEAVRSQVLFMDDFKGATVNSIFADLRREAAEVLELASTSSDFKERRYVEMRYLGQGHDLTVEIPSQNYGDGDHALLEQLFHQTYEKNFNRTIPNLGAQALTWTLVLFLDEPEDALQAGKERPSGTQAKPEGAREIFDTGLGRTVKADVISRQSLSPGTEFSGPAIITEEQTTTYLPPAFSGWINANHHLIMERREEE